MSLKLFSVLSLVSVFGVVGSVQGEGSPKDPDYSPIEIELQQSIDVFAGRGSAYLSHSDVDAFLTNIPESDRAGFLRSADRIADMVDNHHIRYFLAREALDDGFLENEDERAQLLYQIVEMLSDQYQEFLIEEQLLEDYSAQGKEIAILEPDLFKSSGEVSFYHLLILPGSGREQLEKMSQVIGVDEKIQSGSDSFAELVREYSDDPVLDENNGLYEGVSYDDLEPALAEELKSLSVGEVKGPIRTRHGWHFVEVMEKSVGSAPGFEQAKEEYLQVARSRHRNKVNDRILSRILSKPVVFEEGAVKRLLDRYGVDFDRPEYRRFDED